MSEAPEVIVAVDFGMTCTGVAYANLTRSQNVYYIQRWPGNAQANENKVPTVVTYNRRTSGLSTWGFSSESRFEQHSPEREYCQWWKVCLDEKQYQLLRERDPEAAPRSQQAVDQWTEDYLRMLYSWVSSKLESALPVGKTWAQARVEIVFSVPTTWEPQTTVRKFKNIALRAGWGSSPLHVVNIGLTEAEAAAVHMACEESVIFREGDNLLVADCGGGTTDLNILEVKSMNGDVPSLRQLDVVEGRAIGSTQIDLGFEDLVYDRLCQANAAIPMRLPDLTATAWAMMKSRQYLDAKCCFGASDDIDFTVPVPELAYAYTNPQFGIRDGQMQFRLADLEALFDKQVTGLYELVDNQLARFSKSNPNQQVRHLVLSGGLSNSAYVQRRLKERYAMNSTTFSNASNLSVHVSPEPQLAVCKGICLDKIKGVSQVGRAVLGTRCSRASYGTDCKIPYDPRNPEHHGRRPQKDPLDGREYIMNGVAWFIKKGEPIHVGRPIVQNFTRKITPGDPRRAFSDKVITSPLEKDFLPLVYGEREGANMLCRITCDLSTADERKFKVKNRHWWQSKATYMRVQYEVRVIIGPADITFELWFDGQRLSRSNAIDVDWQAASPQVSRSPQHSPHSSQFHAPVHINGFPPHGYPQNGYPHNGYPQNGYPQNGYPPNGYPPNGYSAPNYPPHQQGQNPY